MPRFYSTDVASRLMLGTARFPSPKVIEEAVRRSGTGVVTVSLRREAAGTREGAEFRALIAGTGAQVLPNTAGCHTAREAVTTARMAAELFETDWVKLEVIGHAETLQPDPFALVEAARTLSADGFKVFPYMTEDLILAERLLEAGCEVLMPWGAPIGTGLGLTNPYGLRMLRARFPEVPMVVDAGIGVPSHAAAATEMGFEAVLANTAVAEAGDPPAMAEAMARAAEAGAMGRAADPMEPRDMARPSTPEFGQAVLA